MAKAPKNAIKKPTLIFKVPGPDEPGYLERMIAVGGFIEMIESKKVVRQGFMDLVRFLADYVREPQSLEERLALLEKATETEIKGLLNALADAGEVDPTKDGDSEEPLETSE